MINKLKYICLAVIIYGCNSVQNTRFETNKNVIFSSKKEIVNYFHKTNKLEKNKLYFFSNENDKVDFLLNKTDVDVLPYYGLFVNDTTKISDYFIEDKDCIGVVDKFVRGNYNSKLTEFSNLKKYSLTNYLNEPLNLNKKKSTLVFVVHSNMGKIINYTANYVVDHIKKSKDSIDYIYLVSDPVIKK